MRPMYEISQMTMSEFSEALFRTKTAVLPMGSTEEHGLHLPLDTDTMQVFHTARLAARKAEFFLCPPVHYGYCRSTRDHAGTLSISPDTLRALVRDLGKSLYSKGIRGLIILSGHAGKVHMSALEEAAGGLADELDGFHVAVACEYHWAAEEGRGGMVETPDDGHAGEIETSRIMAMAPGLVKGSSPEEYPDFPTPFIDRDKLKSWPGGVWGDPSKASVDKGLALFEKTAERLAQLVLRMEERTGGRGGRGNRP